jgi:hypothetical protein
MQYRGDPLVYKGASIQRSETGVYVRTDSYVGIPSELEKLIANTPLGAQISINHDGGYGEATIRTGDLTGGGGGSEDPTAVSERWEIDEEMIERDIISHPLYDNELEADKEEFKRWRQDPSQDLAVTEDSLLELNAKPLVLIGVESYRINSIVLRMTRTRASILAPRVAQLPTLTFYTTTALKRVFEVPDEVFAALPTADPFVPPTLFKWGWLPNGGTRSFIGRGLQEESRSWTYAAWDTTSYQIVTT